MNLKKRIVALVVGGLLAVTATACNPMNDTNQVNSATQQLAGGSPSSCYQHSVSGPTVTWICPSRGIWSITEEYDFNGGYREGRYARGTFYRSNGQVHSVVFRTQNYPGGGGGYNVMDVNGQSLIFYAFNL